MSLLRSTSHRCIALCALTLSALFVLAGCSRVRGAASEPEIVRPEALVDYPTLYKDNCAACHGATGAHGASVPLANPIFLSIIGHDTLRDTIAKGVPNALMPAFGKAYGGTLTDQQVDILAQGMIHQWSSADQPAGNNLPPYKAVLAGDATRGQQAYASACSRCHGPRGEGDAKSKTGSITDPTYLALVSDQYLRNLILGGRPDENMPDYRSDLSQPLTDQQITDIVTWLGSKRIANPGQPYHRNDSKYK